MIGVIMTIDRSIDTCAGLLDRARQFLLRSTLHYSWLSHTYQKYESRTFFGLLLTTAVIFPVALLRPDVLLAMGPFIFGYPHMIASYRYLFYRESSNVKNRPRIFLLLCAFTVCTILLYNFRLFFSTVSFAVWPQVLALFTLLTAHAMGLHKGTKALTLGVFLALCLAAFAWQEPILFAGAILMLHNAIAYVHWMVSCKDPGRRRVAVFATVLFFAIHAFVLLGGVDSWLETSLLTEWKIENTAWFLASWSQDPLVWYRWLVLYTFGLSMHYFVWLRALPESELKTNAPLCFRLSLHEWRKDLGPTLFKLALLISVAGFSLSLFHFKMGQLVYFQIALLHGALEVVFLPSKIFKKYL